MFYALTLPLRIVFGVLFAFLLLPFTLLFVPFFLLRLLIKTAVAVVVLSFILLATGIGVALAFIAVLLVVLIPLLPIAFVTFCVWVVVRLASRPVIANS